MKLGALEHSEHLIQKTEVIYINMKFFVSLIFKESKNINHFKILFIIWIEKEKKRLLI